MMIVCDLSDWYEGFTNVGPTFDHDKRALELSICAEIGSRVKPLCDPSVVVWGRNVEKVSKSALAMQLAFGVSERLSLKAYAASR